MADADLEDVCDLKRPFSAIASLITPQLRKARLQQLQQQGDGGGDDGDRQEQQK